MQEYQDYEKAVGPGKAVYNFIEKVHPGFRSIYEPFCHTGSLLRHFSAEGKICVGCDINKKALAHLNKLDPKIKTIWYDVSYYRNKKFACDVTYVGNQSLYYFKTLKDLKRTLTSLSHMTKKTMLIQIWLINEVVTRKKIVFDNDVIWSHSFDPFYEAIEGKLVKYDKQLMYFDWVYWQPRVLMGLLEELGFKSKIVPLSKKKVFNDWVFLVAQRK